MMDGSFYLANKHYFFHLIILSVCDLIAQLQQDASTGLTPTYPSGRMVEALIIFIV